MTRRGFIRAVGVVAVLSGPVAVSVSAVPAVAGRQVPTATPELLLDQGKRLFEAFQYDQAMPLFDRLIAVLAAGGQVQRPELLLQAYELRGRARFALNDTAGAEQDFSALLALNPGFKFPENTSPRVVDVLNSVRRLTIGQIVLSIEPAGEIQIDGKAVSLLAGPQTLDLPAGEHQITATRPSYRAIAQKFSITAGESTTLALTLERVMSTIAVTTVPADVEVFLDGTSRGSTVAGTGETSAPLTIADVPAGTHRLLLRRPCYRDLEQTIDISRPDDIRTEPLRLTATTANVRVEPSDPAAIVFMDGTRRGTGSIDLVNVCEGPHVIEVRSPKGRFIDRRDWKTGDAVTLKADLRTAFPVVSTPGVPAVALDRLRANVERVLAPARRVLVYFPGEAELANAIRGEDLPAGWLSPDAPGDPAGGARISREVRRDLGRKIAGRLEVQGIAAVTGTSDPNIFSISILAAGSGEPDVVSVSLTDPTSRTRATDFLGASFPPVVRAALDASVVDVLGTQGAVVIRTGPAGAKAGLAVGDVIVGAGAGAPTTSVGELRTRIASAGPQASGLVLEVRDAAGASKKVAGAVSLAPETWPPREASLPYNRALIDLQDSLKGAAASVETTAATLNLAVVHMRLSNWEEALATLALVKLPDGSGVSAGTVSYFMGLSHEALGHGPEAQAAFKKAAASAEARISQDGPLVAPLAQRKLQGGR